jgi:hypothetical protein
MSHETRGKLLSNSGDCNGTTTNEYVRFDHGTLFVIAPPYAIPVST